MKRILIIDDDHLFAGMLQQTCENAGYQTFMARDGLEGVDLYLQHTPDLVITDIVMPNQDGIGVILEIRKNNPSAKIIAISGGSVHLSEGFTLPMARKLGASMIFEKPFERRDLLDAIAVLLAVKMPCQ